MKADSTSRAIKDTCLCRKVNRVSRQQANSPKKIRANSQTIENNISIQPKEELRYDEGSNWLEVIGVIIWPVVTVIIFLFIQKHVRFILRAMGDKIIHGNVLVKTGWGSFQFSTAAKIDSQPIPTSQPTKGFPTDAFNDLFEDRNGMSYKILSTLWKHQNEYDKAKDLSVRWSFTLLPDYPEFGNFQGAINNLTLSGLVARNEQIGQYYLTNIGFYICQTHREKSELGSFTFFPS